MNVSHENRFLISCTLIERSDDLSAKVKDVPISQLDWDEIVTTAFWHGVGALLYSNLTDRGKKLAVPENVMAKLRDVYFQNIARNTYLYAELKNILDAFQEKSIDVILLKGLALGKTVYKNSGTRRTGDIDLLVHEGDLPMAENIMSRLGYLYAENRTLEWSKGHSHHLNFIHPEKNIPVEIHWHITHKSHPGQIFIKDENIINQFWNQARKVVIDKRDITMLCPEDLLIYLSHHFMKHRFLSSDGFNEGFISRGALMQLYDIIRVLICHEKEINWESLQRKTEEYGLDRIVCITLSLAKELEQNDNLLPEKVENMFLGAADRNVVSLMLKRIFLKENSSGVTGFLIQSFGENTAANGIKKIYRTMFPSPKIISEKYSVPVSSKKLYLCYLRRPFDVLLKHRNVMSDMPQIKDDARLKKWLYSQNRMSH